MTIGAINSISYNSFGRHCELFLWYLYLKMRFTCQWKMKLKRMRGYDLIQQQQKVRVPT